VIAGYSFWTGRKQVALDGRPIADGGGLALRWQHDFDIEDQPAHIAVSVKWLHVPQAELTVGGRLVAPIGGPGDMPAWAWGFVALNLALLIVSLGGAIPGALAGAGAVSCSWIARGPRPLGARLALCAAVTLAAWAGLGLLVGGFAR
jgi:hypothetical protein